MRVSMKWPWEAKAQYTSVPLTLFGGISSRKSEVLWNTVRENSVSMTSTSQQMTFYKNTDKKSMAISGACCVGQHHLPDQFPKLGKGKTHPHGSSSPSQKNQGREGWWKTQSVKKGLIIPAHGQGFYPHPCAGLLYWSRNMPLLIVSSSLSLL